MLHFLLQGQQTHMSSHMNNLHNIYASFVRKIGTETKKHFIYNNSLTIMLIWTLSECPIKINNVSTHNLLGFS